MNILLRIVQGPNQGAEIALVEGLPVKLGKDDSCDIVLADPTLPGVACQLEANDGNVTIVLPGGTQERLEAYQIRQFGATAFAVGDAESVWPPLTTQKSEEETEEPAEDPPVATPTPEPAVTESAPAPISKKQKVVWGIAGCLVLLFLLWFAWCLFMGTKAEDGTWRNRTILAGKAMCSQSTTCVNKGKKLFTKEPPPPAPPAPTLNDLAEKFDLKLELRNGVSVLSGNFSTALQRHHVAEQAYKINPAVSLSLTDDESLKTSANELLFTITEGKLNASAVKDRRITLEGSMETVQELRRAMGALLQDVPHIEKLDVAAVRLPAPPPPPPAQPVVQAPPAPVEVQEEVKPEVAPIVAVVPEEPAPQAPVEPAPQTPVAPPQPVFSGLPFSGILTTPYPCIVLQNGSRLLEGATLNQFVVEKIAADGVLIKDGNVSFQWKP